MKLWWLKVKSSLYAAGKVIARPRYLLLAVLVTMFSLGLILWAFNFNLLAYILTESPLSAGERLSFLFSIYGSLYTNFENPVALSLVVFAGLFGVNMAVLVYVVRRRGRALGTTGRSAGGLVAAIVGAGCGACGTSIITPILYGLGASSTVVLAQRIGLLINLLSIGLVVLSIYGLGKLAATIQAANISSKEVTDG